MAQRQKFWSHATGFKMGRKLADWGTEKHTEAPSISHGDAEDEDIQAAIALSLAVGTRPDLYCKSCL